MQNTDLETKLVGDIIPLVADLHALEQRSDLSTSDTILIKHALLSAKISRLSVFSSQRAERISDRLLLLTWFLLIFTAALLALTIYLCADVYESRHADQPQQPGQDQQPAAPPPKPNAGK